MNVRSLSTSPEKRAIKTRPQHRAVSRSNHKFGAWFLPRNISINTSRQVWLAIINGTLRNWTRGRILKETKLHKLKKLVNPPEKGEDK